MGLVISDNILQATGMIPSELRNSVRFKPGQDTLLALVTLFLFWPVYYFSSAGETLLDFSFGL